MENNNEYLQFENEFRKLKHSAETGAVFSPSIELTPPLEKNWLDYLDHLSQHSGETELVTIYDFISRPDFQKDLSDDEIPAALESILNYMGEYNINLSSICEVPAKEMYRFIIEELFCYEIENIRVPGMLLCFTYEEFHPNHEYDIKHTFEDFINSLFSGNYEFLLSVSFSDSFKAISGRCVTKDQLNFIFKSFYQSYPSLALKLLSFSTVKITGEKAQLKLDIQWEGNLRKTDVIDQFSGEGVVDYCYEYGFWSICGINLPGHVI